MAEREKLVNTATFTRGDIGKAAPARDLPLTGSISFQGGGEASGGPSIVMTPSAQGEASGGPSVVMTPSTEYGIFDQISAMLSPIRSGKGK